LEQYLQRILEGHSFKLIVTRISSLSTGWLLSRYKFGAVNAALLLLCRLRGSAKSILFFLKPVKFLLECCSNGISYNISSSHFVTTSKSSRVHSVVPYCQANLRRRSDKSLFKRMQTRISRFAKSIRASDVRFQQVSKDV
jgi:hypothetical protein